MFSVNISYTLNIFILFFFLVFLHNLTNALEPCRGSEVHQPVLQNPVGTIALNFTVKYHFVNETCKDPLSKVFIASRLNVYSYPATFSSALKQCYKWLNIPNWWMLCAILITILQIYIDKKEHAMINITDWL